MDCVSCLKEGWTDFNCPACQKTWLKNNSSLKVKARTADFILNSKMGNWPDATVHWALQSLKATNFFKR